MTDIQNFNGRYKLSDLISKNIHKIFNSDDVEIIPFGFENITNNNPIFSEFINKPESNFSHSSMLVKFAPDFIMLKKSEPKEIYFLEIKVSITPLRYYSRLKELQNAHPNSNLKLSDIGDIAREAWNAYYNLYPNTIIIDGCSYNSKVLMAQFVNKIECLMCFNPNKFDACKNCPIKNKDFFEYEINTTSYGSKTPHTNLNYSSFEIIDKFFEKLNIRLNKSYVNELKEQIKKLGIYFQQSTYDSIKEQILSDLRNEGCYWL